MYPWSYNNAVKKLNRAIEMFTFANHHAPSPDVVVAWKQQLGFPNGSFICYLEAAHQCFEQGKNYRYW